jgi:shikimate kinase
VFVNLILIGFMGSGKSTLGKLLADQLNRPFLDTDELVYQKTNTKNMQEVFSKGGEALLRETEIAIAKEYGAKNNLVIATGGGAILNKIIFDYFRQSASRIIFLHTAFEKIIERLSGDHSRPLFTKGEALYASRLPLYRAYADKTIEIANDSPEEIIFQMQTKGLLDGL